MFQSTCSKYNSQKSKIMKLMLKKTQKLCSIYNAPGTTIHSIQHLRNDMNCTILPPLIPRTLQPRTKHQTLMVRQHTLHPYSCHLLARTFQISTLLKVRQELLIIYRTFVAEILIYNLKYNSESTPPVKVLRKLMQNDCRKI